MVGLPDSIVIFIKIRVIFKQFLFSQCINKRIIKFQIMRTYFCLKLVTDKNALLKSHR